MPAGTPGWGGQLDWAPGEAQVWRLGRATECRLASDWAQGRGWAVSYTHLTLPTNREV